MASSTAITTFLRVRPAKSPSTYFEPPDASGVSVEVNVPAEAAQGFINNKRSHWKFSFNGVLDRDTSQEDVFDQVAQPVIESVMSGFNGTIFAYGQTGSGKTYTLTGGSSAYAERGIIPRTLSEVFRAIEADAEAEHTVRVSYLEIYNESGFDLLDPRQAAAAGRHGQMNQQGLSELARVQGVVEDDDGSVRLKGLSSHAVASEEAAINLLFLGDTNRAVSETTMNAASSRSHCIFTICVEARPHGSTTVRRSKLHLVDLAGSERVGKSGASGTTLSEAININSSLHFLEMVIMALHERQQKKGKKGEDRHVPYRNSMLTSVLRDSLGGNCKTVMVATVHPSSTHTDESISTCKFAQRVAQVKNEVSRNEVVDHAALVARLKEENRALREAGGFTDDDAKKSLSAEELSSLHQEVRSFLASDDPEATVNWGKGKKAARVRHAMWILKGLLLEGWRPHHAPSAEAWTVGLQQRAVSGGGGDGGGEGGGGDGGGGDGGGGGRSLSSDTKDWGGRDDAGPDGDTRTGGEHAAVSDADTDAVARRRELLRRAPDAPTPTPAMLAQEGEQLRVAEHAFALYTSVYAHGQALAARQREAKLAYRQAVERAQSLGHSLRVARETVSQAKASVEQRRVSVAVASVLPAEAGYEWHVDGIMQQGSAVGGGASGGGAGAACGGGEGGSSGEGGRPSDPEELRLCAGLQQAKSKYHSLAEELKRLKGQCTALQSRAESLQAASEQSFKLWWPLACDERGVLPPSNAAMAAAATPRGEASAGAAPPAERWAERSPHAADGADGGASSGGGGGGGGGGAQSASAWAAMLNDPEAALAEFRANHWERDKASSRDELKRQLNEAYAGAKEAGERLARKRTVVSELKNVITSHEAAAGGAAALPHDSDVGRLRAQLQMETTMYKGTVGALKELKAEIESLQSALAKSQSGLAKDFQRWHDAALAEIKSGRPSARGGAPGAAAAKRAGGGGARAPPGSSSLRDRTNDDGMRVLDLS